MVKVPKYVRRLLKEKEKEVIKIDLGPGPHKQEGFIGIDIKKYRGVDIVHDLESIPWPIPSECATLVISGHLVEHINPHRAGFIKFMNEAWRILKYDGQFFVSTPYAGSRGYWGDPTHINPCTKDTWGYFNPDNRLLYDIYRPLPWKIKSITWQTDGNMEVLLVKRRIDKGYNCLFSPDGKDLEDNA